MRHKCKKFKKGSKQSGITLVALVVTVVILLILAGISIYLVLDNNGIIAKADEARDRSYIETIKEARGLWNTDKYLDSTTESLADYLYKQGVIRADEKEIVESGGTITRGKYSVSFQKTLVDAFIEGELQVGDLVDYQNPTTVSAGVKATDSNYSDTGYTSLAERTGMSVEDGYSEDVDQTFTINQDTRWVVLGLSEDGTQLMLTTEEPLQEINTSTGKSSSQYFYLRGAKGCAYDYGIAELNKICAIYKNDLASEARSLTIDDINRLCNVTVDIKNKQVTNSESENIDKWGDIGTKLALVNPYQDQEGYLYQSPEDYIDGNALEEQGTLNITSDEYYYLGNTAIDSTSSLYKILFGSKSNYYHYWLASRAVGVGSDSCWWGPGDVSGNSIYSQGNGIFSSWGDLYYGSNAVRPVVLLRSDVTINEIKNKVEIGDYVNYTPDVATDEEKDEMNGYVTKYSGYSNNNTVEQKYENLKWRVLDIDDDGTITLISEGDTSDFYLEGPRGYNNGVKLLNTICNTYYSNEKLGATSRNLNREDIEKYVDKSKFNAGWRIGKYEEAYTTYNYYPLIYPLENNYSTKAKNQIDGVDTTGTLLRSEQLEWIDGDYTQSQTSIRPVENGYVGKTGISETNHIFKSDIYYELFLKGTSGFWLSTRECSPMSTGYACWCIGFAASDYVGGMSLMDYSIGGSTCKMIRPIVSINSNIECEDGNGSLENPWQLKQ